MICTCFTMLFFSFQCTTINNKCVRVRNFKCIQGQTRVSDRYCSSLSKPTVQKHSCHPRDCSTEVFVESRVAKWVAGSWGDVRATIIYLNNCDLCQIISQSYLIESFGEETRSFFLLCCFCSLFYYCYMTLASFLRG